MTKNQSKYLTFSCVLLAVVASGVIGLNYVRGVRDEIVSAAQDKKAQSGDMVPSSPSSSEKKNP